MNKYRNWKHPAENKVAAYWKRKHEQYKSTRNKSRSNVSRDSSHIIIIVVRD